MPNPAKPALTPDVSRYLQTVLLPLVDDLLRRIQATVIALRDVDRSGMPDAVTDRLEIVTVLLRDIERSGVQLKEVCAGSS